MERHARRLHFTMAFAGGFLGVYSILRFAGLFGSAQTSNLILLTSALLGADWGQVLLRLGGAAMYMAGLCATVWLPKVCRRVDLRPVSVVLDMAAAAAVGLFPAEISPVLGLYPLFFAMAFQWNSFPGADGFVSATVFSTNNLRQFTMSLAQTLAGEAQTAKAVFFGKTLLSFHCGVAAAVLLWRSFGARSAWGALVPCALALVQLAAEPAQAAA